jgi:hypothetical protein
LLVVTAGRDFHPTPGLVLFSCEVRAVWEPSVGSCRQRMPEDPNLQRVSIPSRGRLA